MTPGGIRRATTEPGHFRGGQTGRDSVSAYAPDTLPVRVKSVDLEQLLFGPDVRGNVPIKEAEEIVRRALETVRLMNTAAMNGNPVNGRQNVAITMVRQDTNDFERLFEPIMAASMVYTLAVAAIAYSSGPGGPTNPATDFRSNRRRLFIVCTVISSLVNGFLL